MRPWNEMRAKQQLFPSLHLRSFYGIFISPSELISWRYDPSLQGTLGNRMKANLHRVRASAERIHVKVMASSMMHDAGREKMQVLERGVGEGGQAIRRRQAGREASIGSFVDLGGLFLELHRILVLYTFYPPTLDVSRSYVRSHPQSPILGSEIKPLPERQTCEHHRRRRSFPDNAPLRT